MSAPTLLDLLCGDWVHAKGVCTLNADVVDVGCLHGVGVWCDTPHRHLHTRVRRVSAKACADFLDITRAQGEATFPIVRRDPQSPWRPA
ncbi:hypothetical protein G4X40_18685 [Rhodococcus sp. D2-41]|uniref:hypothetical protein n=1 Tax=Speluncibacter jeojiensis TaxID=2710754 RepID=UPI00240F4B5D|nr:hypothetical protein [Rhodococcus sp. D2-41]MDG3012171.1 hypothetical protein [Rhodococcus sp. D2-41]